jgi:phage portal protein BeeE
MGALVTLFQNSGLVRGAKTSPKNLPYSASAVQYTAQDKGRVAKPNVKLFRNWATSSEWIRGAINIRRSQVAAAEWDIVPYDQRRPYSKRLAKDLKKFLQTPNPHNSSFRSLIEPIVEDLLVLDAGVIEKVRNLKGELVQLWPVDGGSIRVSALWDGSDLDEPRYFWYPDNQARASFKDREMVYMMLNPRSFTPIGLSPMETLKLTIEAELFGHEYNRRQVTGAAPDGVMDLGEGVTKDQVREFRQFFESEIAGHGAIGFVGGTKGAKWIPFRQTSRDMQFLEWQVYLVRKIAVVMGLTPQDLGVTFDINRSTSEIQLQVSEDRGLRPLMSTIQDYLTEEVVWDEAFGGEDNNLAFRFTALNLKETTAKANINKLALAGTPWKTVNEARIEDGREPLKGPQYDSLIMVTPTGAVSLDELPSAQEVHDAQARARAGGASENKPPKGD